MQLLPPRHADHEAAHPLLDLVGLGGGGGGGALSRAVADLELGGLAPLPCAPLLCLALLLGDAAAHQLGLRLLHLLAEAPPLLLAHVVAPRSQAALHGGHADLHADLLGHALLVLVGRKLLLHRQLLEPLDHLGLPHLERVAPPRAEDGGRRLKELVAEQPPRHLLLLELVLLLRREPQLLDVLDLGAQRPELGLLLGLAEQLGPAREAARHHPEQDLLQDPPRHLILGRLEPQHLLPAARHLRRQALLLARRVRVAPHDAPRAEDHVELLDAEAHGELAGRALLHLPLLRHEGVPLLGLGDETAAQLLPLGLQLAHRRRRSRGHLAHHLELDLRGALERRRRRRRAVLRLRAQLLLRRLERRVLLVEARLELRASSAVADLELGRLAPLPYAPLLCLAPLLCPPPPLLVEAALELELLESELLRSLAPREADERDPLRERVPHQLARVALGQPGDQLHAHRLAVVLELRQLPLHRRVLRRRRLVQCARRPLRRVRRPLRRDRAPLGHRRLLAHRLQLRLEAPYHLEVAHRRPAPLLGREQLELLLSLRRLAPCLGQLKPQLLLRLEQRPVAVRHLRRPPAVGLGQPALPRAHRLLLLLLELRHPSVDDLALAHVRLPPLLHLGLGEGLEHLGLRLELGHLAPVGLALRLVLAGRRLARALLEGTHQELLLIEQLAHLAHTVGLLGEHAHVGLGVARHRECLEHVHQLDDALLVQLHLAAPLRLRLAQPPLARRADGTRLLLRLVQLLAVVAVALAQGRDLELQQLGRARRLEGAHLPRGAE